MGVGVGVTACVCGCGCNKRVGVCGCHAALALRGMRGARLNSPTAAHWDTTINTHAPTVSGLAASVMVSCGVWCGTWLLAGGALGHLGGGACVLTGATTNTGPQKWHPWRCATAPAHTPGA